MKNKKLFPIFAASSVKEKYLIYKGPDTPPPPAETGKETKLSKEAQESLKAGDKFYDFMKAKMGDLKNISKPTEDKRKDHYTLKTDGYEFDLNLPALPTSPVIEIRKGGNVLTIILETKGQYLLAYNDKRVAAVFVDRPDGTTGDQPLLKATLDKFHNILQKALEKANKEIKDF